LEVHPDRQFVYTLKCGSRDLLKHSLIAFTVTVNCRNVDIKTIADPATNHGSLKTRDDVPGAVEVSQRIAALRRVDNLAICSSQRVVKCHDTTFSNLHGQLLEISGAEA
jgi:hypothetical protein